MIEWVDEYVLFEFNLVVFAVIGVSFAIIWLITNFYHFYPYVRLFVAPLVGFQRRDEPLYVDESAFESVPRSELPTIDVLLPAYEEGNVIQQSIRSIRRANYPQELISVNVLLEPEDDDTRAALADLSDDLEFQELTIPDEYMELVVPPRYPGAPNKPRALNYGFEVSDGDVVGVIDAEDLVDPDLFGHVTAGQVAEDRDYAQGVLDMVNEGDGWLNTLFRAEYAWWFRWLLPSFDYSDYPVPLGGTTNFFHRKVLAEISELRYEEYGNPWTDEQQTWLEGSEFDGSIPWDPRNVTEDFELGLFLWKEGYDLGLLRAVTREESPLSLNAWLRQRTRWQKGKLYSFVQYAYDPPASWRARFHLMLQSFLPHLAPINLAGVVILGLTANVLGMGMPIGIFVALTLSLVFLVMIAAVYAVSYWYVSDATVGIRGAKTLLVFVTVPFYWLPLWGAELRAMRQLYGRDLTWEKTPHHGRNVPGADRDDERSYTTREVVIGLAVLVLGLGLTLGLPILLVN